MKQWFLGLAPRERMTVGVGGGVVALVLLYVLVVEPVVGSFNARSERIETLERDLAWMQEAAGEVRALRGMGVEAADVDDDRPAYLAVDSAVNEAGLRRPGRLEPEGEDGARVRLDEVVFDDLMTALGQLQTRAGIHVVRARFERLDEGRVQADLTLERQGR